MDEIGNPESRASMLLGSNTPNHGDKDARADRSGGDQPAMRLLQT